MDYRQWVGSVELVSLTDGQLGGAPTAILPTSSADVWREEFPELLDGNGLIHPRYGSVALRSEDKLIVVDTRAGPPEGRLLRELDAKVVNRDEVDRVVLTHLHGDHIGGNLIDGRSAFPNARYLV